MAPTEPLARDFTELRVYREAFEAAMTVYRLSASWPPSERFGLADQARRSARSVCASIAEGWHKRPYPRHFASKMSDATSEAAETLVWLQFAVACEYNTMAQVDDLQQQVRRVIGGLVKMTHQAERWCGPGRSLNTRSR